MHVGRGSLLHHQGIAPFFQFVVEIAVFLGTGRIAGGNAAVVIGSTVLAYVLVTGTVVAVVIGGQFWEKGERLFPAGSILAEDSDYLIHAEINHRPRCEDSGKAGPLAVTYYGRGFTYSKTGGKAKAEEEFEQAGNLGYKGKQD